MRDLVDRAMGRMLIIFGVILISGLPLILGDGPRQFAWEGRETL